MSTLVISGAGVASQAAVKAPSHSAHAVVAAHVTKPKVKKVAFKGTYTGTIKLLWSSSAVTGTIVSGKGTATNLPASKMTGSGTGADTAYTDPFSGTGVLAGGGSTLKLSVVKTASSASVADGTQSGPQSPPTLVTVIGQAKVTGGTGKWKGVSGTLKFSGSFSVSNSTSGTSESDSFTATLSGTLTVKS